MIRSIPIKKNKKQESKNNTNNNKQKNKIQKSFRINRMDEKDDDQIKDINQDEQFKNMMLEDKNKIEKGDKIDDEEDLNTDIILDKNSNSKDFEKNSDLNFEEKEEAEQISENKNTLEYFGKIDELFEKSQINFDEVEQFA